MRVANKLVTLTALGLGLVFGSGCMLNAFDIFGNKTVVTEEENAQKEQKIEDDRIEDKHPVFDPTLEVTETFDGCEVTLNKSAAVTKLDVLPFEGDDEKDLLEDKIFRTRAEALAALSGLGGSVLPSMEVVNGALKPFNDGLYAAIEVGLQLGVPEVIEGKRDLLEQLLAELQLRHAGASGAAREHLGHAVHFIGTALHLAGALPTIDDAALAATAAQNAADFIGELGIFSRPIGFYSWNATLQGVFRQDRWLQDRGKNLDLWPGVAVAVAVVLAERADLRQRYEQVIALYAGLTNPYASYTPLDLIPLLDSVSEPLTAPRALIEDFRDQHPPLYACDGSYLAIFPYSRGKDSDFLREEFCDRIVPPGTDTMGLLIKAIRSGALDVAPDEASGWYDYQLWALETLLLPERAAESDHLLLTAAYKKKLIETFKSILTQNRETHVKQLDFGVDGVAMPLAEVDIYPKLPVEPFPTFYLRSARGYRFLATYLRGVLGDDFLATQQRLLESDERGALPLAEELAAKTELLYGLYALSARGLGMRPEEQLLAEETAAFPLATCVERAQAWLGSWREDPDILRDPRVITPIWHASATKRMLYWAVLGVKVIKISAEYVDGHEPKVVRTDNCQVKEIVPHNYYLLMEQMEQVETPDTAPPPTRDEFRAICDQHDNVEDMLAAFAEWQG